MKKQNFLTCKVGEYAVIINRKKEVLVLLLPEKKKYPVASWTLPGGRLNKNDEAEDALLREVKEETGLKVKILAVLHTGRFGYSKPRKYCVFYLCKAVGRKQVKLSHEHIDAKWLELKDINKLKWYSEDTKIAVQRAKKFLDHEGLVLR